MLKLPDLLKIRGLHVIVHTLYVCVYLFFISYFMKIIFIQLTYKTCKITVFKVLG
jgi:hypothetical protein